MAKAGWKEVNNYFEKTFLLQGSKWEKRQSDAPRGRNFNWFRFVDLCLFYYLKQHKEFIYVRSVIAITSLHQKNMNMYYFVHDSKLLFVNMHLETLLANKMFKCVDTDMVICLYVCIFLIYVHGIPLLAMSNCGLLYRSFTSSCSCVSIWKKKNTKQSMIT